MTSPNLKPVFLDNQNVGLMGDPKPKVAKVVAATGKKPENFRVTLLQSEKDTQGKAVALDFVLDRTLEPGKPIYLLSVNSAAEASTTKSEPVTTPAYGVPRGAPAPSGPSMATPIVIPSPTANLPAPSAGDRNAAKPAAAPVATPSRQTASAGIHAAAPVLDVEKALKELATTSIAEIEHSTALTWGARAVASFQLCAQATEWRARFQYFCDGENYRQEALEHAATATDWQQLMPVLDAEINKSRANAENAMQVAKPVPPGATN